MFIERIIQIVVFGFVFFMVAGGGFAKREVVPEGVLTTILTLYKTLPPAPAGPSYCSIVAVGDYGLVLPCDFKPPFLGWLEGGKY